MHQYSSHEDHEIMTRIYSSINDINDQFNGNRLESSRDFHESQNFNKSKNQESYSIREKVSASFASGREVHRESRGKDTLVPSRRLIALVNNDSTFIEAQRHLRLFPQVAYKLVRDAGVARVKQVTDFILSLALETPYFQVDKYGKYDPTPEGQRDRARKMLINMALTHKPILEKYAGPSYFKKWPKSS